LPVTGWRRFDVLLGRGGRRMNEQITRLLPLSSLTQPRALPWAAFVRPVGAGRFGVSPERGERSPGTIKVTNLRRAGDK
ncbi:hypothetical protein, partial [Roseibacillus persicicus]|uniref:hypothetical protein n=1 Tax=Roseibacillus persicicus TaxID=454148 RepID=UPI00280ECED4